MLFSENRTSFGFVLVLLLEKMFWLVTFTRMSSDELEIMPHLALQTFCFPKLGLSKYENDFHTLSFSFPLSFGKVPRWHCMVSWLKFGQSFIRDFNF